MKKMILVVGIVPFLAACESVGPLLEGCERLGRAKDVTLYYGEAGIQVLTKEVKRKSVYIIKLKPKKQRDFADKMVTITGESVKPGGPGVADPEWLNKEGTYDTVKEFVYCTPDVPDGTTQEYKFSVEVETVGKVDPRVDVTH